MFMQSSTGRLATSGLWLVVLAFSGLLAYSSVALFVRRDAIGGIVLLVVLVLLVFSGAWLVLGWRLSGLVAGRGGESLGAASRSSRLAAIGLLLMAAAPFTHVVIVSMTVATGTAFTPGVVIFLPVSSALVTWMAVLAWRVFLGSKVFLLLAASTSALVACSTGIGLYGARLQTSPAGGAWQEVILVTVLLVSCAVLSSCIVALSSKQQARAKEAQDEA